MTCLRCDAPVADDTNFCTRCGEDLRAGVPAQAAAAVQRGTGPERRSGPRARSVAPELVACPTCGATNAASRRRCGRCHADLAGGRAPLVGGDEVFSSGDERAGVGPGRAMRRPGGRGVAVAAVATAVAVAAVVVLVAVVGRAAGWFSPSRAAAPASAVGQQLEVVDAVASSQLASREVAFGPPSNVLDDDPTTAWVEGVTGHGTGEWIELRLAEPALVERVLVWNGHQRGELFEIANRVASLRIDVGGRSFTVDLLDARGPQAVDLPEAVLTDTVRLTIERVTPGERGIDTAISEVEVYGQPTG